jgi:iron(II)-dependent oxidoreductase
MAGNMYEYVADWYNEDRDLTIQDGARNPPLAATGTPVEDLPEPRKILKGGRWASNASATSIYGRVLLPPDDSFVCYGVRFALDVDAVREHLKNKTAAVVRP